MCHSTFSTPFRSLLTSAVLLSAATSAVATPGIQTDTGPWVVSTSSAVSTVVPLIEHSDVSLIRVEAGVPPYVQTSIGGWFALTGFDLGDVDALAFRDHPGGKAHRGSLAFSLLSNDGGFRDGDVLGISAGAGAEVLVPEVALLVLLGIPGGNIDIDGVAFDDQGRLLFSLQGAQTGTVLGDVENGDVLRVESGGGLTRIATEADVEYALFLATGQADPIGDVHGVEWIGGELYVAVQAPSAVDGSILRMGANPGLVAPELSFGLIGEELDAIAYLGDGVSAPTISLNLAVASPGAFVHGEGRGFTPGAPVLVLTAGNPGYSAGPKLGSFGELFLDPLDPWLAATALSGFTVAVADGTGSFSSDFFLAPSDPGGTWMGSQGWSLQAVDLMNLSLTAPLRIQVQ